MTAQNHGFAVAPGERRRGQPRLAQRRHRRGARGRRLRHAAVPPRGRARPARRRALLRPDRRGVPKRTDLRSILIVGSGPIRIGQGCEFDYAGVQACRALRAEGYRVVLANSNPATIMTDPEWADATYLEPLDAPTLAELIGRERPDALLPTLGGQTALNLAVELAENGVLARARRRADRSRPGRDPHRRGSLALPGGDGGGRAARAGERRRDVARRARRVPGSCGRPARVHARRRAAAGSRARARSCASAFAHGLAASPIGQVLVERSLEGWQEFELEVVVDSAGNCIVVCSIENLDPVGVHTGDSWTVAPQQTLDDGELQRLRDAAFACARAVGVATGGANVQFAYEPRDARARADRDEPARLPLLRARVEGDRLPDREARRAARRRLHARRAAERHHRHVERRVRARARLRRGQGAALRLRQVPRQRARARDRDARRRRGARARPHVSRGAAEGPRGRRGRRRAARDPRPPPLLRRRAGVDPRGRAELVAERRRRSGEALRAPRRADRARARRLARRTCARGAACPGRLAVDSCAGEFEARTPYYYLSHEAGDGDETADGRRSSCSARARTGSARGSSSTTAACARRRPSGRSGTRSCS